MNIPDGYSDVPPGKVAFAVTHLEMLERAPPRGVTSARQSRGAAAAEFDVRRVEKPNLDWYRELYRRIGENWLWFSRLAMDDAALAAAIHHDDVEICVLKEAEREIGLLELDFRLPGECELAFFGVTLEYIGRGAGRMLMNEAIERAWARPIRRLWVHTCTGDHPAALGFYMRSGFKPFRRQIEVADDPRLLGLLPETACPHVPLIRPR